MADASAMTRMLDSVPFPVAYFDAGGTCMLVNEAAARLYGVPAEVIVGRSFDDLEPWCPGQEEELREALACGRARTTPPAPRTGAGESGYHSVSCFPAVDGAGNVIGVMAIDTDATEVVEARANLSVAHAELAGIKDELQACNAVTSITNEELARSNSELSLARRRVSEELREVGHLARALSEERDTLETIMENAPEACLVYLDVDFNFLRMNSTYAQACQMPKEEMIGRNHFELFPNAENEAIFRKARETGQPVEYKARAFEYEYQPWRGVTYWDWTLTPLKSGDGSVRGFVLSMVEVTDRVRENRFSEALALIDDVIHSTLDTDAIADKVVSLAVRAMGCEAGALLARRDGGWSVVFATPELGIATGPVAEAPVADLVAEQGAPVRLDDVSADARVMNVARFGIKSVLAVPLVVGGRVAGVLALDHLGEPVAFDELQVEFATRLAASMSLALANRDLWAAEVAAREAAGSELEMSNVLLRAAAALARWTDLSKVLNGLSDIVLESIGRRRLGVYLWDEGRRELKAYAHGGHEPIRTGTILGLADLSTAARRVHETRRSMVVDYDSMSPVELGPNPDHCSGLGLVVPLVHRDRLLGLLAIDDEGGRGEYAPREIALVEAIAAQAAVAIENARLYESQRQSTRLEDSLNRILTTFISARDPDEILRDVVEASLEAVGADYSLITALRGGEWVTEHMFGTGGDARLEKHYPYAERAVLIDAVEQRAIQLVEDVSVYPRANEDIARTYGIASLAAVPLILHGEVLAVLELVYLKPTRFDTSTVEFLNRLMVDASLALDQAMEHEYRRRIAETLQEGLLALPEHIAGLEFAHTYHSATEASLVGGDFYDLFELDDGQIGVTIGDISGKGLDAAVLTSLVKNTIRAHAIERGKTPSQVVGFANTILLKGSGPEVFATVFFGVLDRLTGRLLYCNAAHTTGALVGTDGHVTEIAANSPLVGAYADVVFSDSIAQVEPDDTLFLYTDGLVEARVKGELYGEERLFRRLSELHDGDLGDMGRRLIADVVEFTGGRLTDDVATLALRRTEWAAAI
jgi:PAS domain S-box-containing protein